MGQNNLENGTSHNPANTEGKDEKFGTIFRDIRTSLPGERMNKTQSYIDCIDATLAETFDTGEWFQDMLDLRGQLQAELTMYGSIEFKVDGLDEFLSEVKTRMIEDGMKPAHPRRGNAWLSGGMPREMQEEYLDAGAFGVLMLRKLEKSDLMRGNIPARESQLPEAKERLSDKLTHFDEFVNSVRERIIAGDKKYGDQWLVEDQPELIKGEVVDSICYSFFGWRIAKMLEEAEKLREKNASPDPKTP